MSVTRELLRLVGGKKEWVNIGALAQNVKEDKNHRFVTDEEKKSWNEKPSKDGDMAESTVSSLEEAQASFPQPAAGDNQKTLWGKLKKWQQDCIAKFGNYVLTSMITNQHLNSTSNIPTSALVYLMQQAIQQNQSAINVLNTKASKIGTHFVSYYTMSDADNVINALGNVWSGIPDNTCFILFFVWKGQVSHIVGSKATAYYGQFTVESYSEALRLKYYIINGNWVKT